MSTPRYFLFAGCNVCLNDHAPYYNCFAANISSQPIRNLSLSVNASEQFYWLCPFRATEVRSVIGLSMQSCTKSERKDVTPFLITLHYVNVCTANVVIGQYSSNAGSHCKYQNADWFFDWVTRIPQGPSTSLHELPTYWNIRISVFQKRRTAAIFKNRRNGYCNRIKCENEYKTPATDRVRCISCIQTRPR